MKQESRPGTIPLQIIHLLYLIFFASLFSPFRAVNSISIGLILLAGITRQPRRITWPLLKNPFHLFLAGCILFFLLQLLALVFTGNNPAAWKNIQLKSSIAAIPLAIWLSGYVSKLTSKKIITHYCLLLAAAALYCLIIAGINYFDTGDSSRFFYYQLAAPLKQHPVYFSIYMFIALAYLLEDCQKRSLILPPGIRFFLVALFSLFIFLLSSKLVIVFFLLYLCIFLAGFPGNISLKGKWALLAILLLAVAALVFIPNPVGNRFRDLVKGNTAVLQQENFTHNDYFNGIQFRLLQWKLTPQILNEQQSWWTGAGAANAQVLLDQQYLSRNMYPGDPGKEIRGYQGYNTHNQLLESLLKTGIPGLLAFIVIAIGALRIGLQSRLRSNRFIVLLLLVYTVIESVFETQYGISFFSFFISFAYFSEQEPTFK